MDAATCLRKVALVGVVSYATVDASGAPQVRLVSAISLEPKDRPERLFFFTARGKDFCEELLADGRSQLVVHTRFNEMIRVSGVARPVPESEQGAWIDRIFAEQPLLQNVYPGDSRSIGVVFELADLAIEYFDLGERSIFRQTYTVGEGRARPKGFIITDACIGCGACASACPQRCIEPGDPYAIEPEHCLHCGACFEVCPVDAVKRLG